MHSRFTIQTILPGLLCAAALVAAGSARAQPHASEPVQVAAAQVSPSAAKPAASDSLVLYFAPGSVAVRTQDRELLDQASHLYRDGHPVIMIVIGGADNIGTPQHNLEISEQRAKAVLRGLVARGIPTERFQVLAKGETDLAVQTPPNTAEPANRRVEIRWR